MSTIYICLKWVNDNPEVPLQKNASRICLVVIVKKEINFRGTYSKTISRWNDRRIQDDPKVLVVVEKMLIFPNNESENAQNWIFHP